MSGDTTYQALDRLTFMPGRDSLKNGNCIAGQNYYDIYFTGGMISNVNLTDITIDAINNTPIGNTVPSTGAFTSLSSTNLSTTPAWSSNNTGQTITMPSPTAGTANNIVGFSLSGAILTGSASSSNYTAASIGGISITGNTASVTHINGISVGMGTLATSSSVSSITGQEIAMPTLGTSCSASLVKGILIDSPSLGSGSTMSQCAGMVVSNMGASGISTSFGLQISSQSGSTNNYSIFCSDGFAVKGKDVITGSAALATTATTGFQWIPSCAGTPTGAPTAPYTNAAAMVVDTSASKLWILVGSSWKSVALT